MAFENARRIGNRVWEDRGYLRNLLMELLFKDPIRIFEGIFKGEIERNPYFRNEIERVVKSHRYQLDKARATDLYDFTVSAAQLASLLASCGVDFPVERIAEIVEAIPKIPYIVGYGRRYGAWYGLALAIYELLTLLDPTNILDMLPTYTMAEFYMIYRELKRKAKS
ncbi:MAG: hypothetical protein QXO84_00670 [Candidatus Aenigmatarchaeota archaeon]